MFLAQAALAGLVASGLALLGPGSPQRNSLVSQLMVVFSLLQLPLALVLARVAPIGGGASTAEGDDDPKARAVATTLLFGVLLATPAWFTAFALLVGGVDVYTLVLLSILVGYYGLGFALTGRFARLASSRPGRRGAVEVEAAADETGSADEKPSADETSAGDRAQSNSANGR